MFNEPLSWPHRLPFHSSCAICVRQAALAMLPGVRQFRRSRDFNPVEELWLDVYEADLCRLAGIPRRLTRKRVRA